MKVKLSLEEKSLRAMRWSRIVKRHLRANKESPRYILEEVTPLPPSPREENLYVQPEAQVLSQEILGSPEAKREGSAPEKALAGKSIYEQGYQKGYAQGFQEGERTGKIIRESELSQYEQTDQLLLRLIGDLKDFTEITVREAEEDLLQIAIAVARKIIRKEISEDPEILLGAIREALKKIGPTEAAAIRIHPQDVEQLTQRRSELIAAVEGMKLLKFEPDSRLQPGDCVVETPDRMVDTRLDHQLSLVQKKFSEEPKQETTDDETFTDSLSRPD